MLDEEEAIVQGMRCVPQQGSWNKQEPDYLGADESPPIRYAQFGLGSRPGLDS